ncbi:MAG: CBS domain-containing protein [Planctomycetota bacterium]|jgi:CBS domain-containing protein
MSSSEPQSLAELFHLVKSLLPADQKVVSAPPEMKVADAIELMLEHNYSQLPIVAGNAVLGVFSFRSLSAGALEMGATGASLGDLPVDEFTEELAFVHSSDSWESLLDLLDRDDGVLVGNRDHLEGILTAMDVLKYLHGIARPFVLLAEIELSLRRIINACVSDEEWAECVANGLSSKYPRDRLPANSTEVTFNDYVQIIGSKENWPLFAVAFGPDEGQRKRTISRLKQAGLLRNDVFHFRRQLSGQDRHRLADHRAWLQNKLRAFEARQHQPSAEVEGPGRPTEQDFALVLTRRPVPRGQQQLYKALHDAGDVGLAQDELVEVMGRRDRYDLAGVMGALGRRVNNTPGYGQETGYGIGMVLTWEKLPDGQWRYRLRPGMHRALEELNPSWLHKMTP